MSQSVTNAGESQWAFDYPAVKPVVWSGNIWICNKHALVTPRALLLFMVTGLAARDGDEDLNKGLDLGLFLAVVWIRKIWITVHE